MLADLFSSFDPAQRSLYELRSSVFWLLPLLTLCFLDAGIRVLPGRQAGILHLLVSPALGLTKQRRGRAHPELRTYLPAVFLRLAQLNLLGFFSFVFTYPGQLLFSGTLAILLWSSLALASVRCNPLFWFARLVPKGVPGGLAPLLFLTELVSLLVRPITLGFRLTANMATGHLLVVLNGTLLAAALISAAPVLAFLTLCVGGAICLLELLVCVVQAYVFCLLLNVYRGDHPLKN